MKKGVLVRNITSHDIEFRTGKGGGQTRIHWLVADRIYDGRVEEQVRFALSESDWRTACRGYYFV